MHAGAATFRNDRRLTAQAASLALMFGQVPVAVERLALCLETQRRIGASHALLLGRAAILTATQQLAFIRFQLERLEALLAADGGM